MAKGNDELLHNFGDTFGAAVQMDFARKSRAFETLFEGGQWCNQADGVFEQDDAIR
ncbi:MAG TPA: hypothetical protein VKE71_09565 [Candidatus Angelobacter sp.]|nr:hypothetical protein [Candidatus Angelobacter sp.]